MKDRIDVTNYEKGNKCGFVAKPAKPKPRTIQEIFNLAIEAGFYRDTCEGFATRTGASRFMCNSVDMLVNNEIITKNEAEKAEISIQKYIASLGHSGTLSFALACYGLPCEFLDCLAIYSNWKSRPRPKSKTKAKAVDTV